MCLIAKQETLLRLTDHDTFGSAFLLGNSGFVARFLGVAVRVSSGEQCVPVPPQVPGRAILVLGDAGEKKLDKPGGHDRGV